MNDAAKDLIELHKLISEELRHTSTVIWQFAIAIVTLQGGALALALSAQNGSHPGVGKGVAVIGFLLSGLFSIMLVRQATERGGFVDRIHVVEEELAKLYPVFSVEIPRRLKWLTSRVFAWLLLLESFGGFIVVLTYALCGYMNR